MIKALSTVYPDLTEEESKSMLWLALPCVDASVLFSYAQQSGLQLPVREQASPTSCFFRGSL